MHNCPGYTATATGTVNIRPACEISFATFSLPFDYSQYHTLPTPEQILELGSVICGCDATPVISNIHWASQPPNEEWIGEYTITCTSADGCLSSATGEFVPAIIDNFCCEPNAPFLSGCMGNPFPMDLFTSLGGGCGALSYCDMARVIDDSQVNYNATGTYPYTVTCSGCPEENSMAGGQISIVATLCNSEGDCTCVGAADPSTI